MASMNASERKIAASIGEPGAIEADKVAATGRPNSISSRIRNMTTQIVSQIGITMKMPARMLRCSFASIGRAQLPWLRQAANRSSKVGGARS